MHLKQYFSKSPLFLVILIALSSGLASGLTWGQAEKQIKNCELPLRFKSYESSPGRGFLFGPVGSIVYVQGSGASSKPKDEWRKGQFQGVFTTWNVKDCSKINNVTNYSKIWARVRFPGEPSAEKINLTTVYFPYQQVRFAEIAKPSPVSNDDIIVNYVPVLAKGVYNNLGVNKELKFATDYTYQLKQETNIEKALNFLKAKNSYVTSVITDGTSTNLKDPADILEELYPLQDAQ